MVTVLALDCPESLGVKVIDRIAPYVSGSFVLNGGVEVTTDDDDVWTDG
jgi:hypothetical protein